MYSFEQFAEQPVVELVASLSVLLCCAWLLRIVSEVIFKRALSTLLARAKWRWHQELLQQKFFHYLAQLTMLLSVQIALPLLRSLSGQWLSVLRNLCAALTIVFAALALNAVLNALQLLYDSNSRQGARSIKGYIQIVRLALFLIATITSVSVLIDKSPLILLSGFGAMSAILLLIFRDTLLSFVASIQLMSNDMLRIGDWIEMPQVGADGDVVDIALHTVKVQNWDNTITTIPTWRMIAESFKNWRGMQQSGGRRIKRSLRLDTHSVNFLDEEAISRLQKLRLLQGYLPQKCIEVDAANAMLGAAATTLGNQRRLTNIGTFRAYALAYLQQNPAIHDHMICMVRQLEPGADGLPIEVYCFTRTTEWLEFERIQGDIFDHLLAILPEFDLLLYQQPSGADLRGDNNGGSGITISLRDRHNKQEQSFSVG